ncbi:MAG TPA: glycine cleavage system protein H [Bacteroidales bacterium]|nr:glycine cleavage system protein H [Bacteroidales bacterium]
MDGFSYTNIFETKGIEYLIVIAFLLLIIPFWLAINRKSTLSNQFRSTLGVLTAAILRIPEGLYFNRNHTWAFLEKNGTAKIGVDDFLLHVTGEVGINPIFRTGDIIKKGDLILMANNSGKVLRIYSPVSGEIKGINPILNENPGAVMEDPYGKGWVYKIKPTKWISETSSAYLAEDAVEWTKRELEKFKDFLALSMKRYAPETSFVALQDGGELIDRPLAELPDEVWQDFQKSFLN